MRKSKHSKIKNTGLLYEILIRQVTADILDNKNKNHALAIIKERFDEKTELGKELLLYNALINTTFKTDRKADFFISEVINAHQKINKTQLKRQKYNVIKEIKSKFNFNKLFSSKIKNYKTYASIYRIFEYNEQMAPDEKTETYFNLIENLTKKESININVLSEKNKNQDKELRALSYKILLEKFNSKYFKLNMQQKSLLKEYINNVSNSNNLKKYISDLIPNLKKQLKNQVNSIDEKVVKIKLKEAINAIDKICNVDNKSNFVKDITVIQTLRYMELLKEVKKHARKSKTIN
tara:strand:+ start:834 stop:1712 length:879 start_codon:yes stop_codon:yes gene_type:complete